MALLLLLAKLQWAAGWAGCGLHGVSVPLQPAGRHRQLLLCHHMPLRNRDQLKQDFPVVFFSRLSSWWRTVRQAGQSSSCDPQCVAKCGSIIAHHRRPGHACAELGAHLQHDLCLGEAAASALLLRCAVQLLHVDRQPQLRRLLLTGVQGLRSSPQQGPRSCLPILLLEDVTYRIRFSIRVLANTGTAGGGRGPRAGAAPEG